MSNIKNDKSALDVISYKNNFGITDLSETAKEIKDLSQEELVATIEDEETRTALRERLIKARKDGRGAKKKPDSDLYMTMSFKENIKQLKKKR